MHINVCYNNYNRHLCAFVGGIKNNKKCTVPLLKTKNVLNNIYGYSKVWVRIMAFVLETQ